jgi:hypothetical protein
MAQTQQRMHSQRGEAQVQGQQAPLIRLVVLSLVVLVLARLLLQGLTWVQLQMPLPMRQGRTQGQQTD